MTPRRYPIRGGEVLVRPIAAADAPKLLEAFHALSPASRYRRFMNHMGTLSPELLRYLTEVDQHDHIALVALDPSLPGEPIVGVARCIRLADEPTTGEVAVTVADTHQRRGLGTLLLDLLSLAARQEGFRTYRAYVLQDNDAMVAMLEALGGRITEIDQEGGTMSLDTPIPADAEHLPDTPAARAIRAIAREEVEARHPPAR